MQLTESQIKEFVQRYYDEKDGNRYILMQQIAFKLHRGVLSPAEAEILPHVFTYLKNNQ